MYSLPRRNAASTRIAERDVGALSNWHPGCSKLGREATLASCSSMLLICTCCHWNAASTHVSERVGSGPTRDTHHPAHTGALSNEHPGCSKLGREATLASCSAMLLICTCCHWYFIPVARRQRGHTVRDRRRGPCLATQHGRLTGSPGSGVRCNQQRQVGTSGRQSKPTRRKAARRFCHQTR